MRSDKKTWTRNKIRQKIWTRNKIRQKNMDKE